MKNESQITLNESREKMINTWQRAYWVTLKTERAFKRRLKELNSWDACNGNTFEHACKIEALTRLL